MDAIALGRTGERTSGAATARPRSSGDEARPRQRAVTAEGTVNLRACIAVCATAWMKDDHPLPNYAGHRFPPEVIGYAVWAYYRFPLSYRDVEELLAERGVIVSDETIRRWCLKFGQGYANALRQRCPRPDASCRRARCAGRGGSPSRWHLLPRPAAEPRSTALPASASPPTSPKNSPRAG